MIKSVDDTVSFATHRFGSGPRGNGYVKTWRHGRPDAEYCAISRFALSPSHVTVETRDISMAYAVQNLA